MRPAAVITWKWRPISRNYRSTFRAETVNTLFRMVRRHYPEPFRAVCVTDDPHGIDPSIEIVPIGDHLATIPNPHGAQNPSCYRRLRMFAPEAADTFGPRFVSLDLDTVITGDLVPLWDRPEEFVAWGDTNRGTPYNGSMILLTAGARPRVWQTFDPRDSPRKAKAAGCFGSDQGWISYCLGPGEARWGRADGVYSYRNDIKRSGRLPAGARIVFFHGRIDPWAREAQALDWVREAWH
jgi:hypothetical protein